MTENCARAEEHPVERKHRNRAHSGHAEMVTDGPRRNVPAEDVYWNSMNQNRRVLEPRGPQLYLNSPKNIL